MKNKLNASVVLTYITLEMCGVKAVKVQLLIA